MALSNASWLAAKDGWAVGPLEAKAVLRASGKDAKDYLHRMTTQDLNALPPGASAYAAVLNSKGHLLADAHVLVEADGVVVVMDPSAAADAIPHLERFVIMDDVTFENLSAALRVLPLLGPEVATSSMITNLSRWETASVAAPGSMTSTTPSASTRTWASARRCPFAFRTAA